MSKTETLQQRAARLRAEQAALAAEERPMLDRAVEILEGPAVQDALTELGLIRDQLVNENAKRAIDGLISRTGMTLNVVKAQ